MATIITDTSRRQNDFYPTPYGLCDAAVNKIVPKGFNPSLILDPGAGEGRWGVFIKERWPISKLIGIDIKQHSQSSYYTEWLLNDYLTFVYNYKCKPGLIIGNPPFSLAEDFIRKSLDLLSSKGILLFLLKSDFLTGIGRMRDLFKNFKPLEVWYCAKRPSFNTPRNRKTDSNSYALFLWQKDNFSSNPEIRWLDWSYNRELDYD